MLTKSPSELPDHETSQTMSTNRNPDPETNMNSPSSDTSLCRNTTGPYPYYDLPLWRKSLIVFITSFTTMSATLAATSLFPLVKEIAESLGTTTDDIRITNALVLLTMAFSSFIWVPLGKIVGRKNSWLAACALFLLCTLGTGLAPAGQGNLGRNVFVAMRVSMGIQGTYFNVAGQTWLADIFEPRQRGTATGFFLVGTIIGPGFGPCVGSVLASFTSWRGILWLQACMTGMGLVASILLLPDTRRPDEKSSDRCFKDVLKCLNPSKVFKQMLFPNVAFAHLTCGLLSWSQFTLLAAPLHVINARFSLTSPLVSGLFYIAPGFGFVIGTIVGGKFSDMTVAKWIKARGGVRLPQDRLCSGKISYFLIIPAFSLLFGWGLHFEIGGLALPVVAAFFWGLGLLMAVAGVNTYCAEVMPRRRMETIAGKYLVQYSFGAIASVTTIPIIDAIGIGWATTISVGFVILAGILSQVTAKYGLRMQSWVERKGVHRMTICREDTSTFASSHA